MSNVSLPYTTLDGRVGFAEPVPWYWRLFSYLSVWLILGGYLAFPYLTITSVPNPDGTTAVPPAVSTTALIIVVTSFITAGIALTPLLIFATPHNRAFHLHSVYLPALSACSLGTLSHVLIASLSPNHNISLLAGIVGTVLGIISSSVYAAFALHASGLVHARLGRQDPYGHRALHLGQSKRSSLLAGGARLADRNASYSSSVVPLTAYTSPGHGSLRHQPSITSVQSGLPTGHYPPSAYHPNASSASGAAYFPPAPFIHPLQNFSWQQQQQGPRSSAPSSHLTPPSASTPFAGQGPVSVVSRPREVGTAIIDMQEDELTRQQMAALLAQGRSEHDCNRGATYHIDFPGVPRSDAWDSSGTSTPQHSAVPTPSTYYHGGNAWPNGATTTAGTWNGGAMGTLAESPVERDSMGEIHEADGGPLTGIPAHTELSTERLPRSSIEKTRLALPTDAPSVAPPPPAPAVAAPTPRAAAKRQVNAMNALGAAVLSADQRSRSEGDVDREARERRERREERQRAEEVRRERERERRREEAERERHRVEARERQRERDDEMLERRQEGEELRRLRGMARKPSFQDFSPVRKAKQIERSRSRGSG